MSPNIIPLEPFDLIVFGGTGDLARRKLLPALYHRDCDDQMPEESRIIGLSRRNITRGGYAEAVEQAICEHVVDEQIDEERLGRFLGRLDHVTLDAKDDAGWPELADRLCGHDDRTRVFYLATAPGLFGDICRKIGEHDLNTAKSRVVLEKPIGRDLASAQQINGLPSGRGLR